MKSITSFVISITLLAIALTGYVSFRNVVADKSVAIASLSPDIQQHN